MREPLKLLMPKIRIKEAAWKRLRAYIQTCPSEVGGIGTVQQDDDALVVTQVFLIEQEATGANFKLDTDAFHMFLHRWIAAGNDIAEMKFWWHSHANMNTFWSAVDDNTSRRLAGDSYSIAFVGNHRLEHRTCLTLMNPLHIVVDDISIEVKERADPELLQAARDEIATKVRPQRWWRSRSEGGGKADRGDFLRATAAEDDPLGASATWGKR